MGSMRNRGRRITDRKIEAYYELMRSIAETNHERMFEYYVEEDDASVFRLANGTSVQENVYPGFRQNIDRYLAECPKESIESMKKMLDNCLSRPMRQGAQIDFIDENGKSKPTTVLLVSVADLDRKVCMVAGILLEVKDEKGQIDSLTGVYNHVAFESRCVNLIRNEKSKLLFMMLDVDDFKIVNDTLGHNVGDRVLSQTGQALLETVGENGIVGRVGGDEFIAVVCGIESREAIDDFCEQLSENLKNIIFDMEYSASIGMTVTTDRQATFKDLYYEADQAMYYSKRHGKNRVTFFDEINKKSTSQMLMQSQYHERYEDSRLSELDRFSYDEYPDYILIVDEKKKKIVFANKSIRKASVMAPAQFDEYISQTFSDDFIDIFLRKKEQGNRYSVFKGDEHPDNIIAKLLGEKRLIVKLTHKIHNGYRMIKMIDLSDESKLNEVLRQVNSYKMCMKAFIRSAANRVSDNDFGAYLRILKDFYNADCVALIYGNNGNWNKLEEIHGTNAQIMAKVMSQSVTSGQVLDFMALFNESGRVFFSNVKEIEEVRPDLYKRLADVRIWSASAVKLIKCDEEFGTIVLMNPRNNSGALDLLDLVGVAYSDSLFYKHACDDFEYRLNYDDVTGLKKRKTFNNLGESYVEYKCDSMGIFACDIIQLGKINDKFGYSAGNARLRMVADVLRNVFNGFEMYRYEQDEMVVFCRNVDKKSFMGMVRTVRESLNDIDVSVSTGFSWTQKPDISKQLDEVRDMYEIEKQSKLESLSKTTRLRVIKDVSAELENGRFLVYFQPKVDSRTGVTTGAEALIRFKDEKHGLIGPIHFINIMEENNCSYLVDLFVLEKVCAIQKQRCLAGKRVVPISVNFSKTTLEYTYLLDKVREIISRYDLPEGLIQIEITESVGDMDIAVINNIAQSLISMGFRLAMDDFGTKYSNLEMLIKFQFSIAKIDRSLVKDIENNEKGRIMLKHLISMIKELGIECVAEGAENAEQVLMLRNFGCNIIQGYFYSKPIELDVFTSEFVEKTRNLL